MKLSLLLKIGIASLLTFSINTLHSNVTYTNDWQLINTAVTPPADVLSITIGNELVLIPTTPLSSGIHFSGSTVFGYNVNRTDFEQRQVIRNGAVPSGGEEILGWGTNVRSTYLVTANNQNIYLEKLIITENGDVDLSAAQSTGSIPSYNTLKECISTQSGPYLCFYNPSANIAYLLNLKSRHWTSKIITGQHPENLPGIVSYGWTGENGENYIGYIGGVNNDGTASNQGFYINISNGSGTGMVRNEPGENARQPYDNSHGTSKGTVNFNCAHAAAAIINNYPFSFGDELKRLIVSIIGISNNDGIVWGSNTRQPRSLIPSTKVLLGDLSLAFSDRSWWGNSSRTNLPTPRTAGHLQKISINGKATLLYYGGLDATGNKTTTLYRLNTEAPYDAPGTIPSFGLGQQGTAPYKRNPLHYFSRNDNPSHLFTAGQNEVDRVKTNLSNVFTYEGISHWIVGNYTLNAVPVYRMYNSLSGAHFYTANQVEVLNILEKLHFFSLEGVAFFVFHSPEPGTLPVYRFWVPETASHYFTISEAEKNQLISSGQQVRIYEGIAWYAYPNEN